MIDPPYYAVDIMKMIMILKELAFLVSNISRLVKKIDGSVLRLVCVDAIVQHLGSWFVQVAHCLASHQLSMCVGCCYANKPNSSIKTMLRRNHQDTSSKSQQGSKQCALRYVIYTKLHSLPATGSTR